jgi:hypothetical protein
MAAAKPVTRADIKDADDWWGTLSDQRRVSLHRWQTGQSKTPPPPDPDQLSLLDAIEESA